MFQEKERLEYISQKAPEELKNRTWSSIQQENRKRTKQRRQVLVMAACFAGVLLASNLAYRNSTIVKVNGVLISYMNVSIENNDIPFAISEKRNEGAPNEVPMEINVRDRAHVEVSEGSIRSQGVSEDQEKEIQELDIMEPTVILWRVNGDSNTIATCTITTEDAQYQYEIEKNESSWKLRLKAKK